MKRLFEGHVVGCWLVVPQQLLHMAEELGAFSVAELFSMEQLLELVLLRGSSVFDKFRL